MSGTPPINPTPLPLEMWDQIIAQLPDLALLNLIRTHSFFGLLSDTFWNERNRIQYPFTERDGTKTAFQWFKYSHTIRDNISNHSCAMPSFPCLTTMNRHIIGAPIDVHHGEKYIAAQSHCGLLEWFDAKSHQKLGETKLGIGFQHLDFKYHIIEYKGSFCIHSHNSTENTIIVFCPETQNMQRSCTPLPLMSKPIMKIYDDHIYLISDTSLEKFELTDLESSQKIELLYEHTEDETRYIPDFNFDKEKNTLYALTCSRKPDEPGSIAVYDLNIESTDLKPLYEIPIEKVPVHSQCILEKGSLFFFHDLTHCAKKWEINFATKNICEIYSTGSEAFAFEKHFIQEDYIYSEGTGGKLDISDAHTGELLMTYTVRDFESVSIKKKPWKDRVAFLCKNKKKNLFGIETETTYTIKVLDFRTRKQPPTNEVPKPDQCVIQ